MTASCFPLSPPREFELLVRKGALHCADVVDYLAVLAWSTAALGLVGGPGRLTISAVVTQQFHGGTVQAHL